MVRARRLRMVGIVMLITVLFVVAVSPTSAQTTLGSVSGNIASGAQYDLWAIDLAPGLIYTATLVCDFDGTSRPLDPVLSVYFPGSDPDVAIDYDVYDDDGFGLDDDPNGVNCDQFQSSRVRFSAPVAGEYVFRVDGFGTSTGPYTLTIIESGPVFGVFPDGRINNDAHAPVVIYCRDGGVEVWVVVSATTGELAFSATAAEISAAAAGNVASARGATLVKLADGRLEVQATQSDGKGYIFRWDACPMSHYESYVIDNGVPWLTSSH